MKTKVVFRKHKDGEIVALFPEIPHNYFLCTCYAHIGQHSSADYNYCLGITKLATASEYQSLHDELVSQVGYDLQVIKRFNPAK